MYEELTYPSADKKTAIHAYIWRPHGQVRAVVQIIHGMAEYALRYAPFAEYLAARGFLVCAEDHLGHGRSVLSADCLGYFDGLDGSQTVLADIRRLTGIARAQAQGLPFFIMGHSMGSFFCRKYISLYGGECAGAIIMGTEGDGLAPDTIAAADYVVRIPMSHNVDSLNVAAAAAVAFWELRAK